MKNFYSLFIILAGCLWGVMGLFVRCFSEYDLSSFQITTVRLVSGAVMLLLFVLLYDRKLFRAKPKDLLVFAAIGILSSLMMSWLYFEAINRSTLSTAAILLYTAPIWVLIASVIFYKERLTAQKIIALILAFLGCVFVSGLSGGGVSTAGILFGLGSGVAYALYSIIGKYALKEHSPITVTMYSFLFAAVGAMVVCKPVELTNLIVSQFDGVLAIEILGIGFVTLFAPYLLYTIGLNKTPAGKAAIMASAEPMVATLSGIFIYHEMPNAMAFIGIAMIITAIILLNTKKETVV